MKIIILHGDDTVRSYERLGVFRKEAKKRDWDIDSFEKEDKLDIKEKLKAKSLFSKEVLYIINDVNILSKQDLEWMKDNKKKLEGTLIVYSKNTISKGKINSLPKAEKVEEYRIPVTIWKFLESFYPGNAKASVLLLHKAIQKDSAEFVFAMLTRHLRDVYWEKQDSKNLNIPSWRKNKLSYQASKYRKGKLKRVYSELAKIDVKSKSTNENLIDLLDFLIISELE